MENLENLKKENTELKEVLDNALNELQLIARLDNVSHFLNDGVRAHLILRIHEAAKILSKP